MSGTSRRFLVSSINFAPDHAGIGVYSTDWPVFLAEQGHDVTMVTGFPYYPQWTKRPEDARRLFARETYRGVRTLRGYLYVPRSVSALRRLWHELTFCLFAGLNVLRAGRPDAIVVFTPPFFLGMVGVLAKWLWRRPLVINIQDLPLDAAFALDMVKRGVLTRALYALEGWMYRRADLVATISPTMLAAVEARGVRPDRLALVPNWIDVAAAAPRPGVGGFLTALPEASGRFTIAYAGNLGIKQGIDRLLHLAKALDTDADLHIFVIGDGADRERLHAINRELGCTNVTFLPFLDAADYQSMLADADVMFLAQRSGAGDNFFPSKLLGITAAGKPLLVAADEDSELARIVRETGCGLVSGYDDLEGLITHVRAMQASPALLAELGSRGAEQVRQFDRAAVLGQWLERINTLIDGRGRPDESGPSAPSHGSRSAEA